MSDQKNKEELEQKENLNQKNQEFNKTQEELFSTIAEWVKEYYEKNKDSLWNMSLQDIFLSYISSQDKKEIIEQIKQRLWRDITFDDIKNLYLQSNYTLEQSLTKDVFKTFKRKNAIKSVINSFDKKIKDKLVKFWITENFDLKQFLPENISNYGQINSVFENIRKYFINFLSKVSKEQKLELKNIKITNEEILNQLIIDKVLTQQESKYLKKEIDDESKFTQEQIDEVFDIQNTLFNANIVNTAELISEKVSLAEQDFLKIWKLPILWDIIWKYNIIEWNDLDNIWNNYIKSNLTSDDVLKIKNCEWDESCEKKIKKQIIEKWLKDKNNFLSWVKEKESDYKEEGLSDMLLKILNKEKLAEDEVIKLFSLFWLKDKYIEHIVNLIVRTYKLDEIQKENYKKILNQFLDPWVNEIDLNWKKIKIDKQVFFPEDIDFEWLFEISPEIIFTIKGDDVDFMSNLSWLDKYFTEIFYQDNTWVKKTEKVSWWTKTKIEYKDENWNEKVIEWYILDWVNEWEFEVYDVPYWNWESKLLWTIYKNYTITNIEQVWDKQLVLNSNVDLKDIVLSFVWVVAENNVKEYNKEKIKKIFEDTKSNKTEEHIETTEERIENFNKEFWKLEWDVNTKFEVWTVLEIKWVNLWYPGFINNWYYGEIINIDEQKWTYILKLDWWALPLEGWSEEIEVPIDAKILKKLKFANSWNVFKFKKVENLDSFWNSLKNIDLKSDYQWLEKWLSLWKYNIEVKNWKLINKENDEEIKFIWNDKNSWKIWWKWNDHFDVYWIEVKNDWILLTHPFDNNFSKKVDFNTFMMIFMQNKLSPWTEKEFWTIQQNAQVKPWTWSKLRWFALADILLSSKQVFENIKYYFKEDDELRAAEMYEKMASKLPNWWILGDVKMEAAWEKHSKIFKRIENAKARLDRAGEWKWPNHGKDAANIIEREIFKKVENWKKLWYRQQLKAAWYLLYAIEKWPSPYFRALAKYEWKWYWIKALLWESHYQKRQLIRTKQEEALKKDPTNAKLKQDLVYSEMFYLKDADGLWDKYSNRFWPSVEGGTINLYQNLKVDEVYEWESTKANYYTIYDGLKSYISNNRPPNALWWLKAITEVIDSQDKYVDYYKIISSFIFTGYLYNNFNEWFWNQFNKICRTYWVPIWLFATDKYWLNKVLTIFDYVVKKKQIKPWWKDTFTEYLYWKKNADDVDVLSLETKQTRDTIFSKLEDFWKEYWNEVVSVLDYSDTTLINYSTDKEISDNQKWVLWEYFDKVNDNIIEKFAFDNNLFKSSYAPYYQEWIFNIPAWTFSEIALNLDEWDFESDIAWVAQWMWSWVVQKLDWIGDLIVDDENDTNTVYSFVLKKYINWMWRLYKWDWELSLINALFKWDKDLLDKTIVQEARNTYWYNGNLPIEMVEWLNKFVEVLSKRPKNIRKILNNVFWENKVERAITTIIEN